MSLMSWYRVLRMLTILAAIGPAHSQVSVSRIKRVLPARVQVRFDERHDESAAPDVVVSRIPARIAWSEAPYAMRVSSANGFEPVLDFSVAGPPPAQRSGSSQSTPRNQSARAPPQA